MAKRERVRVARVMVTAMSVAGNKESKDRKAMAMATSGRADGDCS